MKIELSKEEAGLIKILLQGELSDDDMKREHKEDLIYHLGKNKGKEVHKKIYDTMRASLKRLSDVADIDESHGFTLGIAHIVDDKVFEHIVEE
jgi:hypothetical protein